VDAVSIAAPAQLHGPLAAEFLEAGVHVLVEKPLAAQLGEAEKLVNLAEAKNLVLQVGHQERAVLDAAGLFSIPEKPRAIASVRKGPFTGRGTDVDVILDLLTHDLDMVHALDGAALERVEARGGKVRSDHIDEVEAQLTFADGLVARLAGSRVAEARERHIRIDYANGHVAIDFLARSVTNTTPYQLGDIFPAADNAKGVTGDPLGFALDRFLAAVRGEGKPLVSGADACFTLLAAQRIAKAIDNP
jgi:predicted dehydrogenase